MNRRFVGATLCSVTGNVARYQAFAEANGFLPERRTQTVAELLAKRVSIKWRLSKVIKIEFRLNSQAAPKGETRFQASAFAPCAIRSQSEGSVFLCVCVPDNAAL